MKHQGKKKKLEKHDYVIWGIRSLLIVSVLINLGSVLIHLLGHGHASLGAVVGEFGHKTELVIWALLTLVLSLIPDFIERHEHIHLPHVLEIVIVVFLYASIYVTGRFDLFTNPRTFWWDDLLHTMSGMIIGFIGFIMVYKINSKYSMNISPLLVAVFAFAVTLSIGVFWEIAEFTVDAVFGTAGQSWDLPDNARLIGRAYQGSGLRDTMSDLIVDSVGALLTSVLCYFMYKNEKRKTLKMMQNIFPGERERADGRS